jgi:hypothetical protein
MEGGLACVNVRVAYSRMPFLLVLAAVLAVALMLGRAFVGAIRFRPLLRFTPLNAAASAVLGLLVATVVYAWLAAAGLRAGAIAAALPLLALGLGIAGRRAWPSIVRPRGPLAHWIAVGGIAATAALLGLLPVLRARSFAVDNDVHTYCALSEWLQGHGLGSPVAWDPESPVTYFPELWQRTRDPQGAAFPLALVQAAFRSPSSLTAYPPVAAAGLALAALALAFLVRRALRLSVASSLFAGWLLAFLPSSVHWGHHQGFLQQTLALPVLLASIAFLSRPGGLLRGPWPSAALIALLLAFLLLVYLPFVPLFLAAALGPSVLVARRAARTGTGPRFLLWLTATVALAALASMGALVRAPLRIAAMTGAVPGVHIGLTAREFVDVAVGARLVGVGGGSGGLLLLPLALCGMPAVWRRSRTGSVLAVLALLLAALAYYALVARDPWTGATGHTWSVFKLLQWTYPLVLLLQVSGLSWLFRRWRSAEPLGLAALGLAALAWLPAYWSWSGELGQSLRRLLCTERPLEVLGAARQRLHALPGGPLFVVNRPADVDPWLGTYAALLAYPRPIVADWEGSIDVRADFGAEPWRQRLRELGREGGPVPVVLGPGASAEGLTQLGAGFALVPNLEPRLVQIRNPDDLRGADDRPPYWLGPGRTKLAVFSGAERTRELVVSLRGRLPATVRVAVRGPAFAGQSWRTALRAEGETTWPAAPETTLPLVLEPGLTRIALRAPGATEPQGAVLESVRLVER